MHRQLRLLDRTMHYERRIRTPQNSNVIQESMIQRPYMVHEASTAQEMNAAHVTLAAIDVAATSAVRAAERKAVYLSPKPP